MKTEIRLAPPGPPGQPGAAATTRRATAVWRATTQVLRSQTTHLVNALFASNCRLCEGPLTSLSQHPLCEHCAQSLTEQTGDLCTRCGDQLDLESSRFAAALHQTECTLCRLAPPAFTRAVSFADYDTNLREILHLLKFNGSRATAEYLLGDHLATAILKLESQAASDLLVIPVPLFAAREARRGFNQSTVLARAALKSLRKQRPTWQLTLTTNILQRKVDTRPLFALNPTQRRARLQGVFKVTNPAPLHNREVLLVDDIMTTGATARECSRVLLAAGATKVWVATVARAQPETLNVPTAAGNTAKWDLDLTQNSTTKGPQQDLNF